LIEQDISTYGLTRATGPALLALAALLAVIGVTGDTQATVDGCIVAGFLVAGAIWVFLGPTLTADDTGVTIRGPLGRRRIPWSDIVEVRHDDRRRTRAIEFHTRDGLVLVSMLLLGRTPATLIADDLRSRLARSRGLPEPVAQED
jgi:hypothetical protein